MIISDKTALERLTSPNNLLNRLSKSESRGKAMSLFGIGRSDRKQEIAEVTVPVSPPRSFLNPFSNKPEAKPDEVITKPSTELATRLTEAIAPATGVSIDQIVDNADSKIKLELVHDNALDVMKLTIDQIKNNLPNLDNPAKLADVAAKMGKIVDSIRTNKINEAKVNENRQVHYHFYTPEQTKIEEFQVIDV